MSTINCTGPGGRGCSCASHTRARIRVRNWSRRRAARELAAANAHKQRCQRRAGPARCDALLETTIGEFGRTVVTCPACERRTRGICRDCNQPVAGQVGKALRCARHKEVARQAQIRASEERHHEKRIQNSRRYYRDNEDVRRRRSEYKRDWRKTNPDKVREQKRRYIEKAAADPTSAYNRYHARYRTKYREQKRELERDRLAASPAPRKTSPMCTRCGKSTRWKPLHKGHAGKPWTVCTPCLYPCERKVRMRNRRRALARAKEWLESIPPATRIKRPPTMAQRGPGWERTCISPGCDIVVTHRKKKCTKCRQRDAAAAEQKLAPMRGRGRRTDLVRVA